MAGVACRAAAADAPALAGLVRGFGSTAARAATAGPPPIATSPPGKSEVVVAQENIPRATLPGQAFLGDLRSTSALGTGDGIATHTGKWLQGGQKVGAVLAQETAPAVGICQSG